jgi:hypothetical protein
MHNEIVITILILLHNFGKVTRRRYRLICQVVFARSKTFNCLNLIVIIVSRWLKVTYLQADFIIAANFLMFLEQEKRKW